jgi:23S rRNA pseudouridine1911/1915/1917 synthase
MDDAADSRITYRVPDNARIEQLGELAQRLAGPSADVIIGRGGAWIDGKRIRERHHRIAPGSLLHLHRPPKGRYCDLQLGAGDIVYEDEWLVVLNKQAGWYVGATPWDVEGSLLAALERYLTNRDGMGPQLHLAHQLDRDTSGLLLISKTPQANPDLQAAFAEGRVSKEYAGICQGHPAPEGVIQTGHGRSAGGRWRVYPWAQIGQRLPGGGGTVKAAITHYRVEQFLAGAALVQVAPQSGRTHQIRLHMAELGHPLLGDVRYGGTTSYADETIERHLLHATRLQLQHPILKTGLDFQSPLPERFRRILRHVTIPDAG